MIMTAEADSERFQSGANKYAVYLETPEGPVCAPDLGLCQPAGIFFLRQAQTVRCAHLISGAER